MHKFKFDWLIYGLLGFTLIVFGILVLPVIQAVDSTKWISGFISILIITFLAIFVFPTFSGFKEKTTENKLILVAELLLNLFFIVSCILIIFDINILGDNITDNISILFSIIIWFRGAVMLVNEALTKRNSKSGKLYKYIGILLVTIGTYVFFNIDISLKEFNWFVSILFMFLGVVAVILCAAYYPRKKKVEVEEVTGEEKKQEIIVKKDSKSEVVPVKEVEVELIETNTKKIEDKKSRRRIK